MTTLNDIKAAIKTLDDRDVRELYSWLNFYVNRDSDSIFKQWAKQKKNHTGDVPLNTSKGGTVKGRDAASGTMAAFLKNIRQQQELNINVDVWGLL